VVSNAFLVPPILIPTISNLESILTSKAISTSVQMNLRSEVTMDRMFAVISEFDFHSTNYIYISIFLTYLYGEYKFLRGSQISKFDKIEKLKKIDKYDKIYRITRDIMFIIIFTFTKDIQRVI
jgi:hypothetical protein